jgi:hypothetical protein
MFGIVPLELLLVLMFIAWIIFLIDCIRRPKHLFAVGSKQLWIFLFIIFPLLIIKFPKDYIGFIGFICSIITIILYYFLIKRKK